MKWGTVGSGDGQFNNPHGVALDVEGNIIVADTHNTCIQVFSRDGTLLTKVSGDENLSQPFRVAVDREGSILVSDSSNQHSGAFA